MSGDLSGDQEILLIVSGIPFAILFIAISYKSMPESFLKYLMFF